MNDYQELCEKLYRDWSDNKLAESGWEDEATRAQLVRRKVVFDHAPEPYLLFDGADITDVDATQLVFLTTNPGGELPFQAHDRAAGRPSYEELQKEFTDGPYRKETSEIGAAQVRIERMRKIAECLKPVTDAQGFVQCEVVPFHSGSLPNKRGLAKWLREDGKDSALATYLTSLKVFLNDKHVIAIDASNSLEGVEWEHWLRYKANLFDFEPETANKSCIGKSEKSGRESSCVFTQPEGSLVRAYYLTRGGNAFRNHIERLCGAILDARRL